MARADDSLVDRTRTVESTEMTAGVVIFAYDNDLVDYVAMAAWSARNIHRHLNLPVCVITDLETIPDHYEFDQVIVQPKSGQHLRYYSDFNGSATWYNLDRVTAYALSPWEHTLVLDADYVVASNQLLHLFEVNQDFLAHDHAHDITGLEKFNQNNFMGPARLPMSWATVMLYRRSRTAELIFDAMTMIQHNWTHYIMLHGINDQTYRNDYALTMAQSIVNGHQINSPAIPWSLATVSTGFTVTQHAADTYQINYNNNQGQPRFMIINHDFHAMCKRNLGEIVANPC
jgi:hypothetical protein